MRSCAVKGSHRRRAPARKRTSCSSQRACASFTCCRSASAGLVGGALGNAGAAEAGTTAALRRLQNCQRGTAARAPSAKESGSVYQTVRLPWAAHRETAPRAASRHRLQGPLREPEPRAGGTHTRCRACWAQRKRCSHATVQRGFSVRQAHSSGAAVSPADQASAFATQQCRGQPCAPSFQDRCAWHVRALKRGGMR